MNKSIAYRLKKHDILVLLGLLLLMSGGMSLLYGRQPQKLAAGEITDEQVLSTLKSLDAAQGTKKMIDFVSRLPHDQQVRILKAILSDQQSALTTEDKMVVGLGLAFESAGGADWLALLDTVINSPLAAKTPLLYLAAVHKYESIAPSILARMPAQKKDSIIFAALAHAIENNNLSAFERLISALKNISSENATRLLWTVLDRNKDAQFVPMLVTHGADVNKAQGPKTPLIAAVDNQNVEMIQMLIDKGADVNRFADPAVGTPLQRVLSNNRQLAKQTDEKNKNMGTTIELLLRQRGAKE